LATYHYRALSPNGAEVTGVIEAGDKFSAVAKIKESCTSVIEVKEAGGKDIGQMFQSKKVKTKALAMMCQQFSIILRAGLPLVRTAELVAKQTEDAALKKIVTEVAQDVSEGNTLYDAFNTRGPQLPVTFRESIRSGENSGNLDAAFERLSVYYDKQGKTSSKVKSALAYPAFVLVVAIAVIIIIMVYAMPQFTSTFEGLGTELPALTQGMIDVSKFMTSNLVLIIAIIAVLVIGIFLFKKTPKGAKLFATMGLRMPVLGKVTAMSNAAQFAATLSSMLASGLPLLQALGVTGRSMSNLIMKEQVLGCQRDLEAGLRLGDALRDCPDIPELLTEMTAMGEESGTIESTLTVVSDYYDNEVDTATARAMGLLEPAIICFLAVFVCILLLAVYLPIFGMNDAVG